MEILPFDLPTFKSERLSLRPLNPDDYKTLFLWHSDLRNMHLWWADRNILSYEEFVEDLQRRLKTFIQLILMIDVEQGEEGDPVTAGMIYTYNTNLVDRYVYLCVYLVPEYTAKGIGPEAGFLIADYLFKYFGFRKIYSEIFAYNTPSLKAALKNGFKEEGCLKAYRWFGDRHWDLHILSITESDFKKITA